MQKLNDEEKLDILRIAALPAVESQVIDLFCQPGVDLSYQGWATCEGISFYQDIRVAWCENTKVSLSPYQVPRAVGDHIPYRAEQCAGYRIEAEIGKTLEESTIYLPGASRIIADLCFSLFLREYDLGGFESAKAKAEARATKLAKDGFFD